MARRRGALFLPLDTRFFEDDRIVAAGEGPGWLYLAMSCKAKQLETDGELTLTQVQRLGITGWQKRLDALVREGAIDVTESRVQILAWLNHNDPSDKVAERRKKDAERKRQATQSEPLRYGIRTDSGTESAPTPNGIRTREGEGEGEPPNPRKRGNRIHSETQPNPDAWMTRRRTPSATPADATPDQATTADEPDDQPNGPPA